MAPYLHLSLQHGDDLILKRMKRRHSRAQAVELCQRLKTARPEIALGADLIAGFPTETEEHFTNTLSLVEQCGLAFVHAFPFSRHAGGAHAAIGSARCESARGAVARSWRRCAGTTPRCLGRTGSGCAAGARRLCATAGFHRRPSPSPRGRAGGGWGEAPLPCPRT